MKFFSLPFPRLKDTLSETCPPGNLVIGDVTLREVQKKCTEVNVLDYVE